MRKISVPIAFVLIGLVLPSLHALAASLTVTCRADLPVKVGAAMTWRATAQSAVGTPMYAWSGSEGLSGTTSGVTKSYASTGMKLAHVSVHDPGSGADASADCGMHVLPVSYVEPPSVTPVLWVPNGVDPTPMVEPLRRAWRSIHALFFHFYGKTFRMRALKVVVSPHTEADLCGGDCTDLGKADTLVSEATSESSKAIGGVIPYTRALLVMAWGAGGWAGANGWNIARGAIGDFAIAPAANRRIPHIESGVGQWLVDALGIYDDAVFGSIAHELNHVIGWDDPHDFSLSSPPNQYERDVARAGPWLSRGLRDHVDPAIDLTAPFADAAVTGTTAVTFAASDDVGMDAVMLLVDEQLVGVDHTAPFSLPLDTRKLPVGDHQIVGVAFDRTGNVTESAPVTVRVENEIHGAACNTGFPFGTFRACFYDGTDTSAPYLGSWYDGVFPYPAANVAAGPGHAWGGEVAFGRADHVTGVWRGSFRFPTGLYWFRFHTDDGLRVWIDGHLVIDTWTAPQVADPLAEVNISGRTKIKVMWFENDGGAALSIRWSPPTT